MIGFDTHVTFLTLENNYLRLTRCMQDGQKITSYFDYPVHRIQHLNSNTFIIQPKNAEKLYRLTFRYEGISAYTSKLILSDFNSKIVKFLGEKGRLYILLNRGDDYSLKIYHLNKYRELKFIDEIHNASESFVYTFRINKKISAGVLLHSEKKLTKIYEGVNGTKACI